VFNDELLLRKQTFHSIESNRTVNSSNEMTERDRPISVYRVEWERIVSYRIDRRVGMMCMIRYVCCARRLLIGRFLSFLPAFRYNSNVTVLINTLNGFDNTDCNGLTHISHGETTQRWVL